MLSLYILLILYLIKNLVLTFSHKYSNYKYHLLKTVTNFYLDFKLISDNGHLSAEKSRIFPLSELTILSQRPSYSGTRQWFMIQLE